MNLTDFELKTPRLKLAGLAKKDGAGNPVLAVHGWLDNAASFIPLSETLALEQPFYALELPGHGLSEHRPASSSYALLENIVDLSAFVESLSPEEGKVSLIGHSLGGIICALYAAAMPEKVEKLVLLDSLGPMTDKTEAVLPQLRKAMARAAQFRSSKLTVYPNQEMAAKVRTRGIGHIELASAELLVARGTKKVNDGFCWTSDPRLMEPSLIRMSEEQVKSIYGGIECPVCLICGEQGYFSDYAALKQRLAYIPKLEKHIVEGGHHFHMEGDVKKTAEIIHEFI